MWCDADIGPLIDSFQFASEPSPPALSTLQTPFASNWSIDTYFHGFPDRFIVGDSAVWLQFKVYSPGRIHVFSRCSGKF